MTEIILCLLYKHFSFVPFCWIQLTFGFFMIHNAVIKLKMIIKYPMSQLWWMIFQVIFLTYFKRYFNDSQNLSSHLFVAVNNTNMWEQRKDKHLYSISLSANHQRQTASRCPFKQSSGIPLQSNQNGLNQPRSSCRHANQICLWWW